MTTKQSNTTALTDQELEPVVSVLLRRHHLRSLAGVHGVDDDVTGPARIGAQTMTTKQTDTAAMTEEQLDAVAGGLQEACANGTFSFKRHGNMKRQSNRTVDTGRVVPIWTTGGSSG